MFLLLLALLLSPLFLVYSYYYYYRRGLNEDPPSPFKLPIIGNLHQLGSLPHHSLRDLSRKHGPLMLLHLGSTPTLVVSSAEAAREVMKTNDLAFASRPSLCAAEQLFYNGADVALAPYGEYWRQVRKISTVHLLSAKMVQSQQHVREQEVASMAEKITEWSASGPVNLSDILNSLSNEIIGRVALGRKYYTQENGKRNEFCEVVEEMSDLVGRFHVEDCFPSVGWLSAVTGTRARMRRCFRRLDRFLDQVLDDHLNRQEDRGAEGGDLVDVLLSLQRDPTMANILLSDDNIKAIILDMFAAGTDTSYIALEWAMAELVRNTEVLKKAQEEVRGVANQSSSMVLEGETSQMNYLEAVIKEVLRLHPPFPLLLPRESMAETRIGGYKIPSKTRVLVNAWAIGRDPGYWEAPEEFRPERFVSSPVDYKGHDFQFIPFGAGRRICPGIGFATSTVKLALANLLHKFDWKVLDEMRAEEPDMAEAPGISTRKKSNLLLVAVPRSSSS